MACTASGIFLVLKIGFITHPGPIPPIFESIPMTTLATLTLSIGIAVMVWQIARATRKAAMKAAAKKEAQANYERYKEARRLRAAELAADPARAKYASLVERGEIWSDEDIAYSETPSTTNTCSHLQAIERAMRNAGVSIRRYGESSVLTKCRIDLAALQRDFGTVPPVRYAEFYAGERTEHEHPTAFLICDDHKSMIHTLHPEEPGAQKAPWFPEERFK